MGFWKKAESKPEMSFEECVIQENIEEGRRRRKEKINLKEAGLKTIKLKLTDKPQDAYYDNGEVFIAFYLEDTKPFDPSINPMFDVPEPLEGYSMVDFDLDNMPSSCKYSFAYALDRGNLLVYSKVEGKFVSEIKYLSSDLRDNQFLK